MSISNRRAEAEAFIQAHAGEVNPAYRPRFHMTAPCGWINDPNGFSFYRGRVHLFYQYAPYTSSPSRMYWGHCTSEDFVSWTYEGVALAPDTEADSEQCWSGTALTDDQNRLALMYTALRPDADGKILQEQCIAFSEDGRQFVKPPCNPVLSARHLPADSSIHDFRDPKVFRREDGYYAIVANRGVSSGRQLLFHSDNLTDWTYRGIFLEGIGDMPECPDFFRMAGQDVMITSVIGLPKDGLRFQSQHSDVIYLVGQTVHDRFVPERMEAVDLGPDFYAPQSIDLPDGRHVMIGWMQMWGEISPTHYLDHHWNGAMTIPREVWLQDGRLWQMPVRELTAHRGNHQRWENIRVNGRYTLERQASRWYEMDITLLLDENGQAELRLMQTGHEYFRIHYDAGTHILTTDRSRCGWSMASDDLWEPKPGGRAVVPGGTERIALRILVDSDSVEVFVNGGILAMTTLAFPRERGSGISAAGRCVIERMDLWDII